MVSLPLKFFPGICFYLYSPTEAGEEERSRLNLIPDAIPLMKSSQVKVESSSLSLQPYILLSCCFLRIMFAKSSEHNLEMKNAKPFFP